MAEAVAEAVAEGVAEDVVDVADVVEDVVNVLWRATINQSTYTKRHDLNARALSLLPPSPSLSPSLPPPPFLFRNYVSLFDRYNDSEKPRQL